MIDLLICAKESHYIVVFEEIRLRTRFFSTIYWKQAIQKDFVQLRQQNKDVSPDVLHYLITFSRYFIFD